ncbi:MAG: hypothetical protein D4S02_16385 [Rhodocyclaceae bacterium]|nr:MAG: hypothetical protein D4S02_16385 [Rhodocyclaceae bacterium]
MIGFLKETMLKRLSIYRWLMPVMRLAVPVGFIYAYYKWGDAWEGMIGTWWSLLVYSLVFGMALALMTPTRRPSLIRRHHIGSKKSAPEWQNRVDELNKDLFLSPAYRYLRTNIFHDRRS